MAELVVTTLNDEFDDGATVEAPGGDGLSLREAIALASNGDTVSFQDDLAGTVRISEALGALAITADVTIYGDDRITISGDANNDDTIANGFTDVAATAASELDDNQRIFALSGGLSNVVLDGLTLTGGRGVNYGGAIDSFTSDLTVRGSTFAGNVVYGGFGGGAIYSYGNLNISGSTFVGNVAIGVDNAGGNGGGAIFSYSGSLSVVNSTFVGNQALLGENSGAPSGGAIFSNGTPVGATYLNNVTMTGNYAEFQGGGLFVNNSSGEVVITNSLILGNRANVTVDGFGDEIDGFNAPAIDIADSITDGDNAADIFAQTETINGREAGVLADNAGPVQTVALNTDAANPALNGGGLNARLGDARGIDSFGLRDIGAYQTISDQNLVVTALGDGISTLDGGVTLREAILAANGRDGADTITFADGLTGVIRLTDGEIAITEALTIQGGGVITISGDANGDDERNGDITNVAASEMAGVLGDNSRVLSATADLTLDGLTITGGRTTGDFQNGGAIAVQGSLTLQNSTLSGNSTTGVNAYGGAAHATGQLAITNGTISGNQTSGYAALGGGVFAVNTLTITDSTISANSTSGDRSFGGGGGAFGDVSVTGSTISDNMTTGEGAQGGGLHSFAAINVTGSTVSNNTTNGGGASGAGVFGANGVIADTSTFYGNRQFEYDSKGGAIYSGGDVTLTHVTITNNGYSNSANFGGGVYFTGAATVTNSLIIDNQGSGSNGDLSDRSSSYSSLDAVTFVGANLISAGAASAVAGIANVDAANGSDVFAGGLASNGGQVQTVALKAALDNPALDVVNSAGVDARDQMRGFDLAGVANGGTSDLGAFEVQVSDDSIPPTITSNLSLVVGEGLSSGLNFLPVTATDLTAVIFSIGGGPDAGAISIDAATGVLSFGAEPDFETPSDANGDNTFEVFVQATDEAGSAISNTLTITITDVNEAPAITSGAAFTAAENQTLVGKVAASDPESAVSFAITGGADAGLFAINAATGVLSFQTAPDFEAPGDAGANNVHDIEVTVSDTSNLTAVQSVTITVMDVNEAPVASNVTASGDEDTVISGTLTATDVDGDMLTFTQVSGPANGAVSIGANGAFTFTPVADFNGTDSFTFRASDGALSDTATATITVDPVDEPIDPNVPTNGDDTLTGTTLNDRIDALAGNDSVLGLAGDDLLFGRGGDDTLKGAAGDDSLRGNGGDDTLRGNGGDDNIKGNGGEDFIRGNGGNDVIRAGGAADNVKGGGGADLIFGGGGADQLNGGGGADTLRGNGGDDTLTGNGGADIFQFRASDRNDTINDFRQGQDKIQIQSGANSFDALDIQQDGRDVLIGFGAGQVRVVTDNVAAFDESDFIF